MEIGQTGLEKVKKLFHKEITAKTEITGGSWDPKSNTYSHTDTESGVTTEYKLRKNDELTTGYSVKSKFFKEMPDANGNMVKTQVKYDEVRNEWLKSEGNFALKDLRPQKKMMATLTEHRGQEGSGKVYSLVVEPAKYLEGPQVIPVVMPPNTPPGSMGVR